MRRALKVGEEVQQDDLVNKLSAEAIRQLNELVLKKDIVIMRKQIGNEIKTVYRRVR